jgi:Xaa-Pro aminopeptidase
MSAGTALAPSDTLDLSAIRSALKADGLDGWLLYDFRGLNAIAADLTGVSRQQGHMATRRWYYLVPAEGEPRGLVHAIESRTLAHLPGTIERYSGREQLEAGLSRLLSGARRVAMEYSPRCAIPYISRVDAGTVDLVRQAGVEVVSSGDLVQRFLAVWDERQVASHRIASEKLYRIKDRAFEVIGRRTRDRVATSEYDIQQMMVRWFKEEGLISDAEPNVSAAENSGNPHYLPTAASSRRIESGDLVLLDLWGKLDGAGAVYADITWVGFAGAQVPERFARAFGAVVAARDAGIQLVHDAVRDRRELRGWEVDRAASSVLRDAGYGAQILHRTGHSLGESVHGNGVNLDDYETHDDRRLLEGSGFTIEPGVYFPDFGVRSEINMVIGVEAAPVTGPLQTEIVTLA